MVGVEHMPNDILRNIINRLPPKSIGQCRCVSTCWNHLISDPSFFTSASSTLFLSCGSDTHTPVSIHTLDESSGVVTDLYDFSMFNGVPPINNWDDRSVTLVGTFSGIVIFAVKDYISFPWSELGALVEERIVLYNPFTGVFEVFLDPYSPLPANIHAYGFGYGANPDELKFVRFRDFNSSKRTWDACDVFDLKTRSWSQPEFIQDVRFNDDIGMFLKGCIYWKNSSTVMALSVDKMVISYMHQPDSVIGKESCLGTCHENLWLISNTVVNTLNHDVWVMKEQGTDNSWLKAYSLTIDLEPQEDIFSSRTIKVTEDGRVIIFFSIDDDRHMIIYDTSKHLYELRECQEEEAEAETGITYQKSLISPMNICRVSGVIPAKNPRGGKTKKSMEKNLKRRNGKIKKFKTKFKFRGVHWPLFTPLWYRPRRV